MGTSTNAGPRCELPATVNAASTTLAMSSTRCAVVADLVMELRIGGWSSFC